MSSEPTKDEVIQAYVSRLAEMTHQNLMLSLSLERMRKEASDEE